MLVSKPYIITLINGLFLAGWGLYGYFTSPDAKPSPTALIPAYVGLAFLMAVYFVYKHNKVVAHAIVVLALVGAVAGLGMGLPKMLGPELEPTKARAALSQVVMGVSCLITTVIYVLNFIHIRKQRKAAQAA